ncbi:MAG: KH domain-containing protein [Bifidobacteriaceae bacterium]|jgi:predicted RNA-binding protein YlqC (UPF0109 family)|nr:KH domain-containing protein [Bifidobacteriaceae bacterium]
MLLNVLTYLIKNIVKNPDSVQITEDKFPYASVFRIKLDQADIGTVIGKRGHTIEAIRTIMNAISGDKKISIDLDT